MYLLTGFYRFQEDSRYFTNNERDAALSIAQRWYTLKRYPTLYHYGPKGPKVVFSWRNKQQAAAA